MARLTPAQRKRRQNAHAANPFASARPAVIRETVRDEDGNRRTVATSLDMNPNRAKRDGAPMNWSARTIAHGTLRQSPAALRVSTPLRTPTGRHSRRGGSPEYSSYTVGTRLPGLVGEDS